MRVCSAVLVLYAGSLLPFILSFSPRVSHRRLYTSQNLFSAPPKTPTSDLDLAVTQDSIAWSHDFFECSDYSKTHSIFSAVGDYIERCTSQGVRCVKPIYAKSASDLTFTTADLENAVRADFLDAGQGTADRNKGWKMRPVGTIRGKSFEDAKLSFDEVKASLEKGTVIFNSAGAHVSETIAPATLAAQDGMGGGAAGVCCNLYVTRSGAATSAPPHTDKQDVVVIQTQGKKHWRVFSPTDPSQKPHVEAFARGKGDDDYPLHKLSEQGGELLLDVVMEKGDILYIPARFPHTTDTVEGVKGGDWSIHMTFGLDNHVWDLDYGTIRRLGLLKAGVPDSLRDPAKENKETLLEVPTFVGKINQLEPEVHEGLVSGLPRRWLSVYPEVEVGDAERGAEIARLNREIAGTVLKLCERIDGNEAGLDLDHWVSVVERFREAGQDVLSIHREMYLAAIEEGGKRREEGDGPMTQNKMDRLSVFRVPPFFDRLDKAKGDLWAWATEGLGDDSAGENNVPDDWATSWELKVGDPVEADLGGCMFPASVMKVNNNKTYDVQFFDGEVEAGLTRDAIVLKVKPVLESKGKGGDGEGGVYIEGLTKKEIKRLKKAGKL